MITEKQQQTLRAAQELINNGMIGVAEGLLKSAGLKSVIRNGRILDESDVTEKYLEQFVTVNPAMIELKEDVRKLSNVDYPVLITGETGTGKEILAKALHGKRDGKIIACNAAGLPEQLIESELFGHVRGAFTGATVDKIGLMTAAKNGTFFLDEVGELPLLAQAKLLRAIQQKVIRKVGDNADVEINCRFVFATNQDLHSMTVLKLFRPDLYARISTFELATLPLSKRDEDIRPILESLDGGKEFVDAYFNINHVGHAGKMDLSFNVRSLEQYVARYRILKKLP